MGSRPVIRWIKGDGLDDAVTRAAIGQATRLFGAQVDYCLCTQGIDAPRARAILEWAAQPVEWRPISEADNPALARYLAEAACLPERFGYWWKWFPERVRPAAPEWILDGDMVVTGKPSWFDAWARGKDSIRVAQDDRGSPRELYGRFEPMVDLKLKFYSGLISLPPKVRYMPALTKVLAKQPLRRPHDGCLDMCEQGVVAATFQRLGAKPIPLYEFPFGRAFEDFIDYGNLPKSKPAWGYHFGHAFRRANIHFERLTDQGVIFSQQTTDLIDRFRWLGGTGQWGVPGWSMNEGCRRYIADCARAFAGRPVLEIGTSRGAMTAVLASLGCQVTTIDHQDRGAARNLAGLPVRVVISEAASHLKTHAETYDLIVCDLHGNAPEDWRPYDGLLQSRLNPGGILLINNLNLGDIAEWHEESGVRWFLDRLPSDWKTEFHTQTPPGVAKITSP